MLPDVTPYLAWAKTPPEAWILILKASGCSASSPGTAEVPPVANSASESATLSADLTKALKTGSLSARVAAKDDRDRPLIACDSAGNKYLLSPTVLDRTNIKAASASRSQVSANWVIDLNFNDRGTELLADLSDEMVPGAEFGGMQFAIVLNGTVLSAPGFVSVISNGQAQIAGNFTETSAKALAAKIAP